jgi:hypothetical protein
LKHIFFSIAGIALSCFANAQPPAYVTPDTPQGSGKFPAVMEIDPSLPTHTVYHPADLAALGGEKMPVVAWANGGCKDAGNMSRYFLSEIASHGYLAVAIGPIASPEVERADGAAPAAATRPEQLIEAIDWAAKENERPASKYFHRLDTGKVAVMGRSCGGLQAIAAASDPRVTTLGVWNSGLFTDERKSWKMASAKVPKTVLESLRVPAIWASGDASDVAFKNAEDDFAHIDGFPVVRLWREHTAHDGHFRDANGGPFGQVAVAWLDWQLKGDSAASRVFLGPDCGLCRKPEWHLRKKNLD